jgi:hypothetical protein
MALVRSEGRVAASSHPCQPGATRASFPEAGPAWEQVSRSEGKATARLSRSLRLETATGIDLLRVMISKSLNFIFSVTVRPRMPLSLHTGCEIRESLRQSAALRRDLPICCRRCWAGLTKRDRVNLSDGGHIENFGVYGLLRRRCKYIVAIDGEQDPKMTSDA